jgi:hypothetical protein
MERSVVRRLNYTNRIVIAPTDVHIDVSHVEGSPPRVSLRKLVLPPGDPHPEAVWKAAKVFLEAWRTDAGAYTRVEIGRVQEVMRKAAPLLSRYLEGFVDEHGLLFRIRVVGEDAKILAEADHVRGSGEGASQDELIRVLPRDLQELAWTIDWSDETEGPCVHVNRTLFDYRTFLTRDAVTCALVLPTVLREVLSRLGRDFDARDTEWGQRWIEFATHQCKSPIPENDEDAQGIDEWVRDAVQKFSAKYRFASAASEQLQFAREDQSRR